MYRKNITALHKISVTAGNRTRAFCIPADEHRLPAYPVDGGGDGAEAAADGPRGGDEVQRLPLHRPVLRRHLQGGAAGRGHGALS